MIGKTDKKVAVDFVKHLLAASKKLNPPQEAEEKAIQGVLIQRRFPVYQKPIPQIIVEQKPAEEIFELGKLTNFAIDKTISIIECKGPDTPLSIKKENSVFMTDIKLTEDEIREVIGKFSKESKVPLAPVFKASVMGLSMTAITSATGSRFLMRRINT